MNRQISLVLLSSIIILSITMTEGTLGITANMNAAKAQANTITTAIPSGSIIVQAGGGNKTIPLSRFLPQEVQIKAGQSVTGIIHRSYQIHILLRLSSITNL